MADIVTTTNMTEGIPSARQKNSPETGGRRKYGRKHSKCANFKDARKRILCIEQEKKENLDG